MPAARRACPLSSTVITMSIVSSLLPAHDSDIVCYVYISDERRKPSSASKSLVIDDSSLYTCKHSSVYTMQLTRLEHRLNAE